MLPFLLDGLNDDLDAASEIMSAGTGISLTCGLELVARHAVHHHHALRARNSTSE